MFFFSRMIGLYGRANCKNVSRIFCFFVRINGLFDSRRRDRNLFIFVWKLYCRNVFLLKNISSHLILGGMTDISKLICRMFFLILYLLCIYRPCNSRGRGRVLRGHVLAALASSWADRVRALPWQKVHMW